MLLNVLNNISLNGLLAQRWFGTPKPDFSNTFGMGRILKTLIIASLVGFFIHKANVCCWAVEHDLQLWAPITLEQPIGKVSLTLEAQPRFGDDISRLSVFFLRPSATLNISKHINLTSGYLWSATLPADDSPQPTRYENRLWQQITLLHGYHNAQISHQLRLEERFLEQNSATSLRAHYMFRLVHPLGQKRLKNISFVTVQELLWNINNTDALPAGFNQARLFSGLRYQINPHLAMEGGYRLQWLNQPNPTPNQLNHVILIRAQLTLPKWQNELSSFSGGIKNSQHSTKNSTKKPTILD
ncbi:MAG: DUF2490 domain-containing protein [Vampirovibrionales bacterium]|nr:DUF2490 domain-containing protein [Vampirovibrionales bacterium]